MLFVFCFILSALDTLPRRNLLSAADPTPALRRQMGPASLPASLPAPAKGCCPFACTAGAAVTQNRPKLATPHPKRGKRQKNGQGASE